MGIRGAKPSIEKARSEGQTFVQTGVVDGVARPADLTPAASHIWDVLLADLISMGVYREADSLILVEVCEMLAEAKRLRHAMAKPAKGWHWYERDIDKDHKEVLDYAPAEELAALWPMSGGYKRLRAAYIQTMKTLKSYVDEFGVTPVARLRLGLLQLQGASLADFFRDEDQEQEDDYRPPALPGEFTVTDS